MSIIEKVLASGKEVWPIIEGGKGVAVSNGWTAGAFAAADAIGTFSGVAAQLIDGNGDYIPLHYAGKTRKERHRELIEYSIKSGISQAQVAHDASGGRGRIHMNVLWEIGGVMDIIHGILAKAKNLIHGITCGAGMPYKLSEIAAQYQVYYYPIISSARAFKALWKRAYQKVPEFLGGVVYEDPWLAGGHNGLSNSEDPNVPVSPYRRLVDLRKLMNEANLSHVPIIMAGGVWHLQDWQNYINNDEIGSIAFQFGTRPLLTQESPVPEAWKQKLLKIREGDVFLNQFSPTGFYSSAVNNNFIKELRGRSDRQVSFRSAPDEEHQAEFPVGPRRRNVYLKPQDIQYAESWSAAGYTAALRTPDDTLIFVTPEKAEQIHQDQVGCMGCLSHCKFSNWKDHDDYTTHRKVDPRSFCIHKTLHNIIRDGDVENELMFSGHNAYKFSQDSFYEGGFIPTVKQLVDRILIGS